MIARGLRPVNGIWCSVLLVGRLDLLHLVLLLCPLWIAGLSREIDVLGRQVCVFFQVSLQESIAQDFLRSVLMFQGWWMCREQVGRTWSGVWIGDLRSWMGSVSAAAGKYLRYEGGDG